MTKKMWKLGLVFLVSITFLTLAVVISCDNGDDGSKNWTVTFDPDGGTFTGSAAGATREVTVGDGKTAAMPANPGKAATNEGGAAFSGWFTEKNGAGTAFTAETKVTANIIVYADWSNLALPGFLAHYYLTANLNDTVSGHGLILGNLTSDIETPDPLFVELKDYAPGKQALFFSGGSGWFAPCGAAQGLFYANGDKVEHLETFTMAAWVKVYDDLFESGGAIFGSGGMGYDDVGAMLSLIVDEYGGKHLALEVGWEIWSPQVISENGGEYGQAIVPIPNNVNWNQWVHFAVTYNHITNIVTFYLNGELLDTDRYLREEVNPDELEAFTGPNFSQSGSLMRIYTGADHNYWLENGGKEEMFGNLTATLVIGASQSWGPIGNIFEGWIQDCRLYDEVLTAEQISVVKNIVTP